MLGCSIADAQKALKECNSNVEEAINKILDQIKLQTQKPPADEELDILLAQLEEIGKNDANNLKREAQK